MTMILITGANRGIGLALTRAFVKDGAQVIACARNPAKAHELAALAKDYPDNLSIEPLDVASPASVSGLAQRLEGRAIDILVNNAGQIEREVDQRGLLDIDYEKFRQLIDVNSLSPLQVTAALYPNIKAGAQKKIVTLSSTLGSIANNMDGSVPTYRATKAMVNQLMRSLAAVAKADGITVALLHPGWVKTDMGGSGADITPETSAAGLKRVIEQLTAAQTGSFLNYRGETLPW